MPELPEVETARSLIAGQALHRRIVGVDDADTFVCRPHTPGQLRDTLTGRTLTSAQRRGKTMWCETSGLDGSAEPGPELGIHLGMGGRIIVTAGGQVSEGGGAGGADPAHSRTKPAHARTKPAHARTKPAHARTKPAHARTKPAHARTKPAHARTNPRTPHKPAHARTMPSGTGSPSSSPTAAASCCSTSAGWGGSG